MKKMKLPKRVKIPQGVILEAIDMDKITDWISQEYGCSCSGFDLTCKGGGALNVGWDEED